MNVRRLDSKLNARLALNAVVCAALLGLGGGALAQLPNAAAPPQQQAGSGELAPAIRLSGALQRPRSLDLAALKALPSSQEVQDGRTYTGVNLWTLLNAEGGLALPASPRNAALAYYVLAIGSDGYQAVFSLSEIDPAIGDRRVLVAYELDGAALGRSGMARLVVPGDKKRGRAVANLVALEVRSAR